MKLLLMSISCLEILERSEADLELIRREFILIRQTENVYLSPDDDLEKSDFDRVWSENVEIG